MRVLNDGFDYQGTPEEIAELFNLLQSESEDKVDATPPIKWSTDDFKPLVEEAETVRQKLAEDPNYSPYGGVVKAKESENEEPTAKTVSAEDNTGVELA